MAEQPIFSHSDEQLEAMRDQAVRTRDYYDAQAYASAMGVRQSEQRAFVAGVAAVDQLVLDPLMSKLPEAKRRQILSKSGGDRGKIHEAAVAALREQGSATEQKPAQSASKGTPKPAESAKPAAPGSYAARLASIDAMYPRAAAAGDAGREAAFDAAYGPKSKPKAAQVPLTPLDGTSTHSF